MLRERAGALDGPPRLAAEALASRLERQMLREARRAARRARRPRIDALGAALSQATAPLASPATDARAVKALVEQARARRDTLAGEATALVREALRSGDDARLHQARIAIKRWRYAIECLAAMGETSAPGNATIESLRAAQQALGHLHDLADLGARIQRRARKLRERRREAEAEALGALAAELDHERSAPLAEIKRLVAALG
jgi:CHAD domain-containing protein